LFTWVNSINVDGQLADLGETIASYHDTGLLLGSRLYGEAAKLMRTEIHEKLKELVTKNAPGLAMFVLKLWQIVRRYLHEENIHIGNLGELSFFEFFCLDLESLTSDHYGIMHPISRLLRALIKVRREDRQDTLEKGQVKTLDIWRQLTSSRSHFLGPNYDMQPHKVVTGLKWKDYVRGKAEGLVLVQTDSEWRMSER
jgi:hypothetical protein